MGTIPIQKPFTQDLKWRENDMTNMNNDAKSYKVLLRESQEKTEAELDSLPVCKCCGRRVYPYSLCEKEDGEVCGQFNLVEYAFLRMPDGDSYFSFLNRKGNVHIVTCTECDTFAESKESIEDAIAQWTAGHIGQFEAE